MKQQKRRASDRLREMADRFHALGLKERSDELHTEARNAEARRRSGGHDAAATASLWDQAYDEAQAELAGLSRLRRSRVYLGNVETWLTATAAGKLWRRAAQLEKALNEIAEPARLPDGWDATEYWHHVASTRREVALKALGRET